MADIEYVRDKEGSGGRLRSISAEGERHLIGYVQEPGGWVKFPHLDDMMVFLKNNNATIREVANAFPPASINNESVSLLVRAFGILNWSLGVLEATDTKLDLSGLCELSGDISNFLSLNER